MIADNGDHFAKPENHEIAILEELKHREFLLLFMTSAGL